MTIIHHRLADISIAYRTHSFEVPEHCPECREPTAENLREENWSTSAFDLSIVEGALEADAEHLDPGEFHPVGVYCRCGYSFAMGEVTETTIG